MRSAEAVQHFGPYQMQGELGRGGMAVAYRALDTRTGRTVALKILLRPLAPGSNEQRRFQREVAALRKLRHPGVVEVLEAGEHQGRGFLALEYLEGGTLEERIKRKGRLSSGETAELGRALAKALHAAHMEQIVHRDLKPANVLFDKSGKAKLADFGLARSIEAEASRLTQSGMFLGTPGYMAPEQVRGSWEEIGPGADVYGLGATLFACLAGVAPVEGDTAADVLLKTEEGRRRSFGEVSAEVDPELTKIVERCLEREVGDRFGGAMEVAVALRRYLEVEEVGVKRGGWGSWVGVVVLAGVLGVGGRVWLREDGVTVELEEPPTLEEPGVAGLGSLEPEPRAAEFDLEGWEGWCALTEEYLARGLLVSASRSLTVAQLRAPSAAEVVALRERLESLSGPGELERWEALREERPEDPSVRERCADLLSLRGEREGALELYRGLARSRPTARYWLRIGELREQARSLEDALEAYVRAGELDPENWRSWQRRGHVLSALGRHEEAEAAYGRSVGLCPGSVVGFMSRGVVRLRLGEVEASREDLERAVGLAPDHGQAWLNLGIALNAGQRYGEAVVALRRVVDPELREGVARHLTESLVLSRRWEEAEREARVWLGLDPESLGGKRALGMATYEQGEREESLVWLLRVAEQSEEAGDWERAKAVAEALGRNDALVVCYARLEELRGLTEAERLGRCRVWQRLERWEEAEAECRDLLADFGERGEVLGELGRVLLQRMDFEGAVACCARSLELGPASMATAANLGMAKFMQEDFAGALEAYELALEVDPTAANCRLKCGESLFGLGEFERALEVALEGEWSGSLQVGALLLRVRCALELGDRAQLEECLAQGGDVPHEGMRRLIQGIARVGLGDAAGAREDLGRIQGLLSQEILQDMARDALSRLP